MSQSPMPGAHQLRTVTVLLALLLAATGAHNTGRIVDALGLNCPTEDSTYCVWLSHYHGNGEGISFVRLTENMKVEF